MIIFNFLIQREHFVRSSGQQEQANARKAKQRLRQISRFVFPVQKIFEPLKLIEDHEIRLERMHAGPSQSQPKVADDSVPQPRIFMRDMDTVSAEAVANLDQALKERLVRFQGGQVG
jgi:hypothetical protein